MADPLPIPWQAPAPAPSESNSWLPDLPSVNQFDMAAVMAKLDPISVPIINKTFGVSITLSQMIDLLHRFQIGTLEASDMVQVIEMGSYFARNTLGWTLAADNLDHWLIAGGLQDPSVTMNHTLFMNQEPIIGTLCDKHYQAIVDGINSRLSAKPGAKFPPSPVTITGPLGKAIVVNPAESPLRAGGEETLYKDSSTLTTDNHVSDLFNAVNAVNLVSQVHVKSEVLDTGGWQVTITDWEVWFYDSYDWNLGGQSVHIPLNLFDKIPGIAQFRAAIEDQLKNRQVDPSALDDLAVQDAQMRKIEGKKIVMPDGTTKQPKAYPIYSDGSWPFDASTCPKKTVLTIPQQ
jgi:hypothetical protein